MSKIKEYYESRAMSGVGNDYLRQVGHTERGRSISQEQFECMTARICELLAIGPQDRVLDICCGNGVVSRQLAAKAASVTGIDFSEQLIGIARRDHSAANTDYYVMDAMQLERLATPMCQPFTKILMQGALQHFPETDLQPLLQKIFALSVANPIILFGFVPDRRRKANFYDTPRRKITSIIRRGIGRDVMGTWWNKALITDTCGSLGRTCEFHDVIGELDACRYRFDVVIS